MQQKDVPCKRTWARRKSVLWHNTTDQGWGDLCSFFCSSLQFQHLEVLKVMDEVLLFRFAVKAEWKSRLSKFGSPPKLIPRS